MTEFGTTLLTMGISSGVYMGFKMQEGKAGARQPVADDENTE